MLFCESWLHDGVSDDEISIPQYSLIRCDRRGGKRGGGVCAYVKNGIRFRSIVLSSRTPDCIEALWLHLLDTNITLLAVYIPPGLTSNNYKEISRYIVDAYDEISVSNAEGYLIIAGDMNQFPTRGIEAQLNVTQIVNSPTRGNAVLDKILLDVRLLNKLSSTASLAGGAVVHDSLITICSAVGNSDHLSVLMNSRAINKDAPHIRKVYDLRASHVDSFKAKLAEFPWPSFYKADLSVDEKCDILHATINHAMEVLPFTYVKMTKNDKPWMTPMLKSLINRRYDAFRCKNFALYLHYKQKVKKEISRAKTRWVNSKMQTVNGLWSVVKSISNKESKQSLNGLLQNYASIHEAVEQINSKLNQSFSTPPNWIHVVSSLPFDTQSWTPDCNVAKVYDYLRSLNTRKAAGSDELPPRLLRDAAYELASPLTHVISLSLETCTVPSKWKKAKVMPIPKKPNPTLDDLRPISLLPVFSKILEKISLDSVKNDLLSMYGSNQFGFRPGYSTVHAHVVFHDCVTRILDSQHYKAAVVISFDMKKAFDSLHHNCLMQSLTTGNFPYKALCWFASFLQDRQQSVCIQGISSSSTRVPSGVPQGSVLSPFLFAAHMGSLVPHDPKTLMLKYAVDIVTITPIEDSYEAALIIKSEIACVNSWCHSHGLKLNMQKNKIMILTRMFEYRC